MTELEQIYAAGYMDKCAEMGVDPEQLIKHAGIMSAIPAIAKDLFSMRKAKLFGNAAERMSAGLVNSVPAGAKNVAFNSDDLVRNLTAQNRLAQQAAKERQFVNSNRILAGAGAAGVGGLALGRSRGNDDAAERFSRQSILQRLHGAVTGNI